MSDFFLFISYCDDIIIMYSFCLRLRVIVDLRPCSKYDIYCAYILIICYTARYYIILYTGL